jgi:hypothetical protein
MAIAASAPKYADTGSVGVMASSNSMAIHIRPAGKLDGNTLEATRLRPIQHRPWSGGPSEPPIGRARPVAPSVALVRHGHQAG